MLSYDELHAPAENGGILVAPSPRDSALGVRLNRELLAGVNCTISGHGLLHWRRLTRRQLGIEEDRTLIVTGHQPAFIHAGVWAKNVVAHRLAHALGGLALNLVVDNDAPDHALMDVPMVRAGRVELCRIPFAQAAAGISYEQFPMQSPAQVAEFELQVSTAMGSQYGFSAMPDYLRPFRDAAAADWVDQAVRGRRTVDELYGVGLTDQRVSRIWWTPLLVDLIRNAGPFAMAYNQALADYRAEHHVRGVNQPIPDLVCDAELAEVPVWAYRSGEPRQRVGVRRQGDCFALIVRGDPILKYGESELAAALEGNLDTTTWVLRPRALSLTLWARLFLADFFIHGIGGAKYDLITDGIIRRYFGIEPPGIACVSGTLRMRLPAVSPSSTPSRLRHELRDVQWNPQRHLRNGREVSSLTQNRAQAVKESALLRERDPANHRARREVFQAIRDLNRRLLSAEPALIDRKSRELADAEKAADQQRVATGREYFFALHHKDDLAQLAATLPGLEAFRV